MNADVLPEVITAAERFVTAFERARMSFINGIVNQGAETSTSQRCEVRLTFIVRVDASYMAL